MQVSRNTVWRLAEKAREKLARAVIEGRENTHTTIINFADYSNLQKNMF